MEEHKICKECFAIKPLSKFEQGKLVCYQCRNKITKKSYCTHVNSILESMFDDTISR